MPTDASKIFDFYRPWDFENRTKTYDGHSISSLIKRHIIYSAVYSVLVFKALVFRYSVVSQFTHIPTPETHRQIARSVQTIRDRYLVRSNVFRSTRSTMAWNLRIGRDGLQTAAAGTRLTDTDVLVQGLRPEVRERTALEHEVFAAHRDFDASLQYEHEVIHGFALLVYDAHRIGLEPLLVLHLDVEYHVLFQQPHQDRLRYHVRLERFDTCGSTEKITNIRTVLTRIISSREGAAVKKQVRRGVTP